MRNKKGFTISEVLVVIAIIGVILVIAIPSIVSIRKRSNERLLESKKDIILVAAELYAKDKGITSDTYVYIYQLVNNGYVKSDVEQNTGKCTGENTSKGCVINPVDDSSLNNKQILVKITNETYIAIWEGAQGNTTDKDLVETVREDLGCDDEDVENMLCVYCIGNNKNINMDADKRDKRKCNGDPNNYLYYSGIMWRVIGVYKITNKDGKEVEVAKMITDDTVVWETETDA